MHTTIVFIQRRTSILALPRIKILQERSKRGIQLHRVIPVILLVVKKKMSL